MQESKSWWRNLVEQEPAQLVAWIVGFVVALAGLGIFTFTEADKQGLTTLLLAIVPIVQGIITRSKVYAPANVLVAKKDNNGFYEVVPGPATVPDEVSDNAILAAAYDDGSYLDTHEAEDYQPIEHVEDDELDGAEISMTMPGEPDVKVGDASEVPADEVGARDPNEGVDEDPEYHGQHSRGDF